MSDDKRIAELQAELRALEAKKAAEEFEANKAKRLIEGQLYDLQDEAERLVEEARKKAFEPVIEFAKKNGIKFTYHKSDSISYSEKYGWYNSGC